MTKWFNVRKVTQLALLSAVSVVLYNYLKFSLPFIFPFFLEMQFSDLPIILAAFISGPWGAVVVAGMRFVFKILLVGTGTMYVGETQDLILALTFAFVAYLVYRRRHTKKGAAIALAAGAAASLVMSVFTNWLAVVPLYVELLFKGNWQILIDMVSVLYAGITRETFFLYYLPLAVVPFNVIRLAVCCLATFYVYKPLSKVLKMIPEDISRKSVYASEEEAFTSFSPLQTEEFAIKLAKKCSGGEIFVLQGEMGAGKTVFAKGFAKGLGVDGTVTSPTFAIHNSYGGRLMLHHFDFYRLDEAEAESLGLSEFFGAPDSVCLIEWGENISGLLPKEAKFVKISVDGNDVRTITEIN